MLIKYFFLLIIRRPTRSTLTDKLLPYTTLVLADRDEYLYKESDARRVTHAETPLTLKGDNGLYLSFHEAALVDFPSMLLAGDGAGGYSAWLMPWPDGTLAKKAGPFATPWRTVLVGDSPGALADSRITLNLNEPNKLPDIGDRKSTRLNSSNKCETRMPSSA